MRFVPGDVVRLNSGGPLMTVIRVDNGAFHCIWHTVDDIQVAILPPEAIYLTTSADEDDEDEMSDEELDELMAESELQQYGYR